MASVRRNAGASNYPGVRSGLRSHQVGDETIVYDVEADRIHLLDSATSDVLKSLQADSAGVPPVFTELDLIAVDELRKAELIDAPFDPSGHLSRRGMLRRAAAIAAGLAVPTIVSLTPTVSQGQSTCDNRLNNGGNHCNNGAMIPCCATDTNGFPLVCKLSNSKCVHPNGYPCSGNADCLSANCVSNVCQP